MSAQIRISLTVSTVVDVVSFLQGPCCQREAGSFISFSTEWCSLVDCSAFVLIHAWRKTQ